MENKELTGIKKKKYLWLAGLIFGLSLFLCGPVLTLALRYDWPSEVKFFSPDGNQTRSFEAYDHAFRGGADVATGDIDGDGEDEIIVGAGRGGGPHLRVFEKDGRDTGVNFFPFHSDFRGGTRVASGDVNNDGVDEIVVSQASLGQAWVKVLNGNGSRLYGEFLAYDPGFEGGCDVAVADVEGDGLAEIVTGAGRGGGPHVRVFRPNGHEISPGYFPFPPDYRGGVEVDAGDFDKDGIDELVIGAARDATARVKVYRFDAYKTIVGEWLAYDEKFLGGMGVGAGDVDKDGRAEVLTIAGDSGTAHVRAFEGNGRPLGTSFFAYPEDYRGRGAVTFGHFKGGNKIVTTPLKGAARYGSGSVAEIGRSWEGRGIQAFYIGDGSNKTLYVGGTHGSEGNAAALVSAWLGHLRANPWIVPTGSQVIIVPTHNPDGLARGSRYNAHGIDLNRNFGSRDWNPRGVLWNQTVSGGPFPFSEPENQALKRLIEEQRPNRIITYHSDARMIFAPHNKFEPGLEPKSLWLAQFYNGYSRYAAIYEWHHYPLTGDLSAWASQELLIPTITVELSDGLDQDRNFPAMEAVMR